MKAITWLLLRLIPPVAAIGIYLVLTGGNQNFFSSLLKTPICDYSQNQKEHLRQINQFAEIGDENRATLESNRVPSSASTENEKRLRNLEAEILRIRTDQSAVRGEIENLKKSCVVR